MATAYTPGLTVSPASVISKERRLPAKGSVLVSVGDRVESRTIVARTEIPGYIQTLKVAEVLGLEPEDAIKALNVNVGDVVEKNQIVAESKSLWGLIRSECTTPIAGTVEMITPATGHIGVRSPSRLVEVSAYLDGTVTEVLPEEGVVIESVGALVQGIFGVGGETYGDLIVPESLRDIDITASDISDELRGKILVGGAKITGEAIRAAAECGLNGVVVGAIVDTDLIEYLGYDIGVAITGQEDIPTTIIMTEGFGEIRMADRTWELLRSLDGRAAAMNGATQIRAGVIRPEIISCAPDAAKDHKEAASEHNLEVGARVRTIREPYFGKIGKVSALPSDPVKIETGAVVRVVEVSLQDGPKIEVPRANVEIIAE